MVEVHALTKTFGRGRQRVEAVAGIDFHCAAGSVFGLLGMNGAGKTTTLRMLGTILRPTSGTATICGCDVVREAARVRHQIGYLSGDTRLYDRLKTREVLWYFGQMQGLAAPVIRQRTAELLDRFELEAIADKRVGKLSTGQKQRVNLARALVHNPAVLILDEPTSGLDVMGAREVGTLIGEARDEGRCIILSTHIMREAEKLCDHIAIIHDGLILVEGSPEKLSAAGSDLEDTFAACVAQAANAPDGRGN